MDPQQPIVSPPPAAPQNPSVPDSNVLPNVPSTWPGAFGIYKYSKQAVNYNAVTLVAVWVLSFVINIVLEIVLKRPGQVLTYVIGGLETAAVALIYLAGLRGQKLSFSQVLSQSLRLWLKMIVLNILVYGSAIISFLLLVVPAFFVVPRLTLSFYFLVDKKMGILESYKASWHATKGHVSSVYGIIGVSILMVLLAITIIGIPFSIYFLIMYGGAFAVLYEFINNSSTTDPATEQAAPVSSPAPAYQPPPAPLPPTPPQPPLPPVAPPQPDIPPTPPVNPDPPLPPTTPQAI